MNHDLPRIPVKNSTDKLVKQTQSDGENIPAWDMVGAEVKKGWTLYGRTRRGARAAHRTVVTTALSKRTSSLFQWYLRTFKPDGGDKWWWWKGCEGSMGFRWWSYSPVIRWQSSDSCLLYSCILYIPMVFCAYSVSVLYCTHYSLSGHYNHDSNIYTTPYSRTESSTRQNPLIGSGRVMGATPIVPGAGILTPISVRRARHFSAPLSAHRLIPHWFRCPISGSWSPSQIEIRPGWRPIGVSSSICHVPLAFASPLSILFLFYFFFFFNFTILLYSLNTVGLNKSRPNKETMELTCVHGVCTVYYYCRWDPTVAITTMEYPSIRHDMARQIQPQPTHPLLPTGNPLFVDR